MQWTQLPKIVKCGIGLKSSHHLSGGSVPLTLIDTLELLHSSRYLCPLTVGVWVYLCTRTFLVAEMLILELLQHM